MIGGIGHFDKSGNACLEFHLCGTKHDEPGVEYSGIIDTGFTGFIQLPLQHAFSLGLPSESTVTVQYADGSKSVCLTALAKVTFADKLETGVVILAPNANDILIGMDFLRRFNLGLFVSKKKVVVIPEDALEEIQKKASPLDTPSNRVSPG